MIETPVRFVFSALLAVVLAAYVLAGAVGCAGGSGITTFAPPDASVMPRRILVGKRGEIDSDLDGFIDGVLVEVHFFNRDREGDAADQPFHRDGVLTFQVFGPGQEMLCEGRFEADTMRRSESTKGIGPGYALLINFGGRGYEDVRERVAARMDFEFVPEGNPESRAFGSTQVRLGPTF